MRIETTPWVEAPGGRAPLRRLIAIGDLHGHLDAAKTLFAHLKMYVAEQRKDEPVDLVTLGDMVDRGPDPIGVLELVGKGLELENVEEVILIGNHDWYLGVAAGVLEGALDDEAMRVWTRYGGEQTLAAIGLHAGAPVEEYQAAMPAPALATLKRMRPFFLTGEVMCVHAGVDPLATLGAQKVEDLMWMREPFLTAGANANGAWPFGATVVHGHTPGSDGVFAHRIGVDTGGYQTGRFSAVEMSADDGVRFHRVVRGH